MISGQDNKMTYYQRQSITEITSNSVSCNICEDDAKREKKNPSLMYLAMVLDVSCAHVNSYKIINFY